MAQPRVVRRPQISPEALQLFVRLEQSQCGGWEEGSHQLARMLGLTSEWWAGQTVLDRSEGPSYAPEYAAHGDWYTCREVRLALLAAANQLQQ